MRNKCAAAIYIICIGWGAVAVRRKQRADSQVGGSDNSNNQRQLWGVSDGLCR